MSDPFRQAVVEAAAKVPFDFNALTFAVQTLTHKMREQRWHRWCSLQMIIAKHKMVTNKMHIVIDLPDDEVKPDHVVQS